MFKDGGRENKWKKGVCGDLTFKQPLFMGNAVYHSCKHILRRCVLISILVNAGSIKCGGAVG